MSTPNSANLMVGSGEVWFNRLDNDGNPTGFRHLGNVSKLEVTPSVTEITSKSSMNAARAVRARAVTETKMEIAMTLNEFDPENVALALLGVSGAVQAANPTITDAVLGVAKLGRYLDTGKKKITVTNVKHAGTTYDVDDDYTVDSDSGLIFIKAGETIVEGDALTWSGSCAATGPIVAGLSQGRIEGALKYRSSDDQIGPRVIIDFYKVSVSPDGALGFLSDQFGDIGVKGEVLSNAAGKYMDVTELSA